MEILIGVLPVNTLKRYLLASKYDNFVIKQWLFLHPIIEMGKPTMGTENYPIITNAIKNGIYPLIVELINKGFNYWDNGLEWACCGGHIKIAKLMIKNGAKTWNTSLNGACLCGHLEMVKLLINHGATDFDRGFVSACLEGHIDIVKLLLDKGAKAIHQGTKSARICGHLFIVDFLTKKKQ